MRRHLSAALICCLVAGILAPVAAMASEAPFADLAGHWAAALVADWKAQHLITGYPDGSFGPERPVTRAELCALLNRVLGLTEADGGPLSDVPDTAWYAADIRRAIAAGYLSPDEDGAVAPEAELTRQELAAMLALALGLPFEAGASTLQQWIDGDEAGAEFVEALAELALRGVIRGFPDGTIGATQGTTRAQAVTMLARAFGQMYRTAGQYGPAAGQSYLGGSATITVAAVTLRNLMIDGDLHITAASGQIRLVGVTVYGEIIVSGAAEVQLDGVNARALTATSAGAHVHATGETFIGRTLVKTAAGDAGVRLGGNGFDVVVVDGSGQVQLDGSFVRVVARRGAANLVAAGGEIGSVVIMTAAAGSKLDLAAGARLGELTALGGVTVTGGGTIDRVGVAANGVVVGAEPNDVVVMPGFEASIGGRTVAGEVALRLEYDFAGGREGWDGGFCDLPADYDPEMYDLEFGHRDLPAELGTGKGLFIGGTNRSDDLFMFVKRALGQAEGVLPNTAYTVQIEIDLATNAPAGAVGVGGAPGEAVFVKVGAAPAEPRAVPLAGDPNGQLVLSVDKGSQNDEGRYAVQVGNAAKGSDDWDWSYEIKTMANSSRAILVTTGEDGVLWVFAGTDSGFEGRTELYYARIAVTLGTMVTR